MEPEGPPRTPGTSYGPPSFDSAQRPDDGAAEPPCSPRVRDVRKSARGHSGNEGSGQSGGPRPAAAAAAGRSTQRTFKSSAFPSSLSWDSDSERETLDEEELQNFANPHGLAAHSPGSPSSGLRLVKEDEREAEKLQHFRSKPDSSAPVEGRNEGKQSTKTEEPKTAQPGQTDSADSDVWNVSEGPEPFLSKVKPKERCQMEDGADGGGAEKGPKGPKAKEAAERDVYTFTGDSDPESPPPAPWAHCTFVQRCRKKRALLRPFSGVAALKGLSPESAALAGLSPHRNQAGVYDFEEVTFEGALEPAGSGDRGETSGNEEDESAAEAGKEIFTCVECSIYFKKRVHLQEHMVEHCEGAEGGGGGSGGRSGPGSRFQCVECGWTLPSRLALGDHHRKHQESREKILKEIEKLNENGTSSQTPESKVAKNANAGPLLTHVSDADMLQSPPRSPRPVAAPDTDPVVPDVQPPPPPPNPVRTPAQPRAAPNYRRRYVCSKCNFSTRTSQALANHSKTHNRKRPPLHSSAAPPGSQASLASCGHCAFRTSSQAILREHQLLVHPGAVSAGRAQKDPGPDEPAARHTNQAAFGGVGTRRFSRRGKMWEELAKPEAAAEDGGGGETGEPRRDESGERKPETSPDETESAVDVKPNVRTNKDGGSTPRGAVPPPPPPAESVKDEDEREAPKDGRVFFLRRSARVTAAPAESDSEDDGGGGDIDEERVRRFLSEGFPDEDRDEIDEDAEALKSVERKCPYCPDRFHNGIGLANHVRGHLNRVGVSYNVRHFISPEEVNAIEKKFSYQKKKKKVANFDPDTFSVMHCEFCSAGFDTRAGLSSHARAHLRDFGITNWDVTISPIHILRELFSSRPDLAIPTGPPRSLVSPDGEPEEEEEEEEEQEEEQEAGEEEDEGKDTDNEGEGIIEVKLEGDTSERPLSEDFLDGPPTSPRRWKKKDGVDERDSDDGEAGDEEDEDEELRLAALDALSAGPGKAAPRGAHADGPADGEDGGAKVHSLKCEVCDARFETRRGLSSHARSHLRQLGITVSESSGAPIDLLYQIAKESGADGALAASLLEPLPARSPSPPAPLKDEELEDMDFDEKPLPLSVLARAVKAAPPPPSSSASSTPTPSPGASPAPAHSGSPSSVVKKAPISSLLPVSSPLRSPEHKAAGMKSLTLSLSGPAVAAAKPLWAPQENDAPLNLTLEVDPNKDIVCQLCGAWFETRKGLSSHARAHLRHFGVEYSESKGSPIDLLNQLIDTEDFKHKASTMQLDGLCEPRGLAAAVAAAAAAATALPSPKKPALTLCSSSSSSSPSSLLYKVTTAGSGSASKATSSSVSSLLGPPTKRLKSSSMQVFRLSSGEIMALPQSEPLKEIGCEFCGEYFENRKGLSSHARSHLRQMGITEWSVNGSPIDTLREIITRRGLPCALPLKPLKTPPPSSPGPPRSPLSSSSSPSATLLGRVPFAFARPSSPAQSAASKSSSASPGGLILKLKPEPVQLEVTAPGSVGRTGGFPAESLNAGWNSNDMFPLNFALAHEVEPTRDIRCEFCGEYFENRKGLSSHARSHLRQMGITEWSVNGSPIDTLREVMHKREVAASSRFDHGVKKESGQVGGAGGGPPWETAAGAGSEGLTASIYHSPKFRKSPLSLLQSGSRLPKQSLASAGASAAPPAGKFFRMSPLGKRPVSEEAHPTEAAHASPHRLKTFSPLPHDFSFKRKPSPDKHGHQDPSCELCGFYFENRKALASHARAHLRQFGVTEWCVNGSPIETLSAWMRSRPQKVLEMHRSYMQGSRSALKKKVPSSFSGTTSSSSSSSSSQWSSSLAVSLVRSQGRELGPAGSSKAAEGAGGGANSLAASIRAERGSPAPLRLGGGGGGELPLQAQVARSELNVRLPRGFERRPLKHPSSLDGVERDSGPPKPPRTGTVPALVPKPPSYPLVKLVGKFYTLKCRFCEVEFHGPLSVQEDWIRHLQQHILKMNYNKPAAPKAAAVAGSPSAPAGAAAAADPASARASPRPAASTSTSRTTTNATAAAAVAAAPALPSSRPPTPPPAPAAVTATEIVKVSEEQPALTSTPIPLSTQTA